MKLDKMSPPLPALDKYEFEFEAYLDSKEIETNAGGLGHTLRRFSC